MIIIVFLLILIILLCFLIVNQRENFKTVSNCFIVISNKVTYNMYNSYSKVIPNNLYFISDKPSNLKKQNIIHYDTENMRKGGYKNMHSHIEVTSWDKVIYFIENNNIMNKFDYVWIIEDDCYLNSKLFNQFINNQNSETADLLLFGWFKNKNIDSWAHWNKNNSKNGKQFFNNKNLRASINQICRMSPRMINKISELRAKHNEFCFHELQFASIVEENKLKQKIINLSNIKMSAFPNKLSNKNQKSLNNLNYLIVHPVKKWYDN